MKEKRMKRLPYWCSVAMVREGKTVRTGEESAICEGSTRKNVFQGGKTGQLSRLVHPRHPELGGKQELPAGESSHAKVFQ